MTRQRIIVGPEAMHVERGGVRSRTVPLDAGEGPSDIRDKAAALWAEIRPVVSYAVWLSHRLVMAAQRRLAGRLAAIAPDLRHPGPRPDLIATKPWGQAVYGEWAMLPHGVVSRLIRGDGVMVAA